jgi:predicted peroxiredoxin
MGIISIVLRKSPYGTVDAAEAVRHALGGITEDMETHLVLIDGGVNAARRGQYLASTGYASIEEGIRDCIDMGVTVSVDKESVVVSGMGPQDLVEGVNILSSSEIVGLIQKADTAMIF